VSKISSLLCLILLANFHKNASFCPNVLNYLSKTFTFGKQPNDNFGYRKVQCRPTYSFTHICARFSFERFVGEAALGGLEIHHDQ